jgi:class 3 adenylate cyclase
MNWLDVLKIAGTALPVVGAVVAITRYVTQIQARVELAAQQQDAKIKEAKYEQDAALHDAQHQLEIRELQGKIDKLTTEGQATEEKYRRLLELGNATMSMKATIDQMLNDIAEHLSATASSILVPAPNAIPDVPPDNLVFLSILPENPALRGQRVLMNSAAGYVYQNGQSLITQNPSQSGGYSQNTDRVANFKTDSILVVPLFHKGGCVGVAEYLNKRSASPFDVADQKFAEGYGSMLGHKIGEFTNDPRNLQALGITLRQPATDATILVSDISNSSKLARSLDMSVVIDLMNQYFEILCDVGLRLGGTVDQTLGDGFMMSFNAKRPVTSHQTAALTAAYEMQRRFDTLKEKWTVLQYRGVVELFNRIGITSGPVHKAEMGHTQFRQITIMGDAVNFATHLCQAGRRDRNIIVVAESFYERLSSRPTAKLVPLIPDRQLQAYELEDKNSYVRQHLLAE